ncbi:hypothetical protein FQA39_LY00251 [Lamprigera yunnana]|nr:hypothetical protein FQA39_LY00251 [Lamprigera yunnana]
MSQISNLKRKLLDGTFSQSCSPEFLGKLSVENMMARKLELAFSQDEIDVDEDPAEYCIGGYFPVRIGQIIGKNPSYRVIRKLGWGASSTVWLAKNTNDHKYYAVKIYKGDKKFVKIGKDEIDTLKYVRRNDLSAPGYNNVIVMQRSFQISSEFGQHVCITFEFMQLSLFDLIRKSGGIECNGAKIIIKQVILGLFYLHNACKIVHTDIKSQNILITINDLSSLKYLTAYIERCQELNKETSKSYAMRIQQNCSSPPILGQTQSLDTESELSKAAKRIKYTTCSPTFIPPNIKVKIADLGNACLEKEIYPSTLIGTVEYRALEVIICRKCSYSADMWSAGCVAYELSTGEHLFNPRASRTTTFDQNHLELIWQLLGGIPSKVALSGFQSHHYFNELGSLKHRKIEDLVICKTELLLTHLLWDKQKTSVFANFIESLLQPDPSQRITASAALKHKWLKNI